MLRDGHDYRAIAAELGYAGPSGAYQACMAVLKRAEHASAEGIRAKRGLELQADITRLRTRWQYLDSLGVGIITEDDARVLADIEADLDDDDPDDREAAQRRRQRTRVVLGYDAHEAALKTYDVLLRAMAREARLFGTDAPTKIDHTVSDRTDALIRQLAEELDMADAEEDAAEARLGQLDDEPAT